MKLKHGIKIVWGWTLSSLGLGEANQEEPKEPSIKEMIVGCVAFVIVSLILLYFSISLSGECCDEFGNCPNDLPLFLGLFIFWPLTLGLITQTKGEISRRKFAAAVEEACAAMSKDGIDVELRQHDLELKPWHDAMGVSTTYRQVVDWKSWTEKFGASVAAAAAGKILGEVVWNDGMVTSPSPVVVESDDVQVGPVEQGSFMASMVKNMEIMFGTIFVAMLIAAWYWS